MKIHKKMFIMFLVAGIFLLPGVTKAALLVPQFQAEIIVDDFNDCPTNSTPFTLQSEDGSIGAKVGYTPTVIDTWVETGSHDPAFAAGIILWNIYEAGEPLEVHLTFKYKADPGNEVWWYTPLGVESGSGTYDGDWHLVERTFTIDATTGYLALEVYNYGGQAVITDLAGLPLPATHTPIPGSLLLLGTGLVGLAALGWRRRKA